MWSCDIISRGDDVGDSRRVLGMSDDERCLCIEVRRDDGLLYETGIERRLRISVSRGIGELEVRANVLLRG
jgi:hypothetical protein